MSPSGKQPTEEISDNRLILHQLGEMSKKLDKLDEQNVEILRRQAQTDTKLALGDQRMDSIDKHLEATDETVEKLREKSDSVKIPYTGIAAMVTALGSWAKHILGGGP